MNSQNPYASPGVEPMDAIEEALKAKEYTINLNKLFKNIMVPLNVMLIIWILNLTIVLWVVAAALVCLMYIIT